MNLPYEIACLLIDRALLGRRKPHFEIFHALAIVHPNTGLEWAIKRVMAHTTSSAVTDPVGMLDAAKHAWSFISKISYSEYDKALAATNIVRFHMDKLLLYVVEKQDRFSGWALLSDVAIQCLKQKRLALMENPKLHPHLASDALFKGHIFHTDDDEINARFFTLLGCRASDRHADSTTVADFVLSTTSCALIDRCMAAIRPRIAYNTSPDVVLKLLAWYECNPYAAYGSINLRNTQHVATLARSARYRMSIAFPLRHPLSFLDVWAVKNGEVWKWYNFTYTKGTDFFDLSHAEARALLAQYVANRACEPLCSVKLANEYGATAEEWSIFYDRHLRVLDRKRPRDPE